MRRASLKRRPSSTPNAGAAAQKEVPWDLFDRLILPLLGCHAAAILISGLLHLLRISQVSTFALFIWFAASTVGAILFYHYLKVTTDIHKSQFKLNILLNFVNRNWLAGIGTRQGGADHWMRIAAGLVFGT